MNRYEEIAREYIEGVTGLFSYESCEMAVWNVGPREVQAGIWILRCLTNPKNRSVLEELMEQSHLREAEHEVMPTANRTDQSIIDALGEAEMIDCENCEMTREMCPDHRGMCVACCGTAKAMMIEAGQVNLVGEMQCECEPVWE